MLLAQGVRTPFAHIIYSSTTQAQALRVLAGLHSPYVYELEGNVIYDNKERGRALMKKFIINYHFKNSGLGELTEEREFNTFLEAMEYIDDRYKIFYSCHRECEFTCVGKDFSIGIVEK